MFNSLVQNTVSLRCCVIWRRVGTDAGWKLSPPPHNLQKLDTDKTTSFQISLLSLLISLFFVHDISG